MSVMSVSDDCSLNDISTESSLNSEDNWEYIRETEPRRFRPETPPLWSTDPPVCANWRGEDLPPTTLRWGTTEYFKKQLEMSKANECTDMKVLCPEDNGSGEREFNMHQVIVLPQVPFFARQASRENDDGKRGELVVRLSGVKAGVFELIREYLYLGSGINHGQPSYENYYDYTHAVNLLEFQVLFENVAIHFLIQNPLRRETQDLCDELSDRIPACVISYVTQFRSWWSHETAEGMPNAEQLQALMADKPFDRYFYLWARLPFRF